MFVLSLAGITGWGAVSAQETITVSSRVTSAENSLPMVGVAVIADPMNATTTNVDGAYTLSEIGKVNTEKESENKSSIG